MKSSRDQSKGRNRQPSDPYTTENASSHGQYNNSYPVSTSNNPINPLGAAVHGHHVNNAYPSPQYNFNYHPQPHPPHPSTTCLSSHGNPHNSMSGHVPLEDNQVQHSSSSPISGNKIVKTWRQMGDKTKSKTRDILKRWQTMNNGQQSEESLHGLDDFGEMSLSSESGGNGIRGKRGKKKNKSWSVHVWTTWVQRPFEDDDSDQLPEGKNFLSDFQVEKFTYYFTDVFDHNKDRIITIEDIQALNERMRHYAGWHDDNEYFITMKEIHSDFFECLLEHVGRIEPEYGFEFDIDRIPDRVQMYQWLNMWGNLTKGAKAMIDFPVWLQILPKILFKVINRRDNGVVSIEELRCFYALFIKLPKEQVEEVTNEAYSAMTSSGDYPLTEDVYLMTFANFLLGKTPHGPGKYIFGGFKDSDVGTFQIDYSFLEEVEGG